MHGQLREIAKHMGMEGNVNTIMFVYPELINTMVVKIMDEKSDLRASSLVFRCLMNLWRTFYYLLQLEPLLDQAIKRKVIDFSDFDVNRRKDKTPNIGLTLAMTLILPTATKRTPSTDQFYWSAFLRSYVKESGLRRVLWWQKDRIPIDDWTTFQHSEISRNNVLFQIMLRSLLHKKPLSERIDELDRLYCNIEGDVDSILQEWKALKERVDGSGSWLGYYEELKRMGLAEQYAPASESALLRHLMESVGEANRLEGYHVITRDINPRGRDDYRRGDGRGRW